MCTADETCGWAEKHTNCGILFGSMTIYWLQYIGFKVLLPSFKNIS